MKKVGEVLIRLIKAYSPTGKEKEAEGVLLQLARELGLEAYTDEVGNVFAEKEGGGNVWLVGHYDTIPGELPVIGTDWMIAGRGAVDAKGPLAAMLVAASESTYPVTVVALVGEEGDSRGAKHLLKKDFPDYIVIGEPSDSRGVVISYRGGARIRIDCYGEGGHSSSPGDSAIDKLISSIIRFKDVAPGSSYEQPSIAVTVISGGEISNVLPKHAFAEVDLRVPPNTDPLAVAEDLRRVLEEDCKLLVRWFADPVSVKPNDPVPRALIRSILSLGAKPKLLRKYGSSDMNLLYGKVKSIAAYGPGDGKLAHTDMEQVSLMDLEFAVRVYMRTVEQLSG